MIHSRKNKTSKMAISFFLFLAFSIFFGLILFGYLSTKTSYLDYSWMLDVDSNQTNKNDLSFEVIDDSITDDSFCFNLLVTTSWNNSHFDPNLIYLTSDDVYLNTIFIGGQTNKFYNLFYEVKNLQTNQVYKNFKLYYLKNDLSNVSYGVSTSVEIKTDKISLLSSILILLAILLLLFFLLIVILLIIFGKHKKKKFKTIYRENNTYYEWKRLNTLAEDEPNFVNQEEFNTSNENEYYNEPPFIEFDYEEDSYDEKNPVLSHQKVGYKLYKPSFLGETSKKKNKDEFSLSAQPFDKVSNNKKVRKRRRDFNNLVEENEFFKVKLNDEEEFTFIDEYEF